MTTVKQRNMFAPDQVDVLDAKGRVIKRTTAKAIEQQQTARAKAGKQVQQQLFITT